MVFMASGVHYLGGLSTKDIIYCPMPLYHSAGGCITMGQAFIFGCTIILKTKFSASAYFKDCAKYNATVSVVCDIGLLTFGFQCFISIYFFRLLITSVKCAGTSWQHLLQRQTSNIKCAECTATE